MEYVLEEIGDSDSGIGRNRCLANQVFEVKGAITPCGYGLFGVMGLLVVCHKASIADLVNVRAMFFVMKCSSCVSLGC